MFAISLAVGRNTRAVELVKRRSTTGTDNDTYVDGNEDMDEGKRGKDDGKRWRTANHAEHIMTLLE